MTPSAQSASGNGSVGTPLRSALKADDDLDRPSPSSGSLKAVHIAEPESEIQLLEDESRPVKEFPAGPKRRLSGKLPPPLLSNGSSRSSVCESSTPTPAQSQSDVSLPASASTPQGGSHSSHRSGSHRRQYYSEKLLAQVGDWLEHERKKVHGRKRKTHRHKSKSPPKSQERQEGDENGEPSQAGRQRADSIDSQSSEVSFDRLQHILEDSMAHMGFSSVPHFSPRIPRSRNRRSSSRASYRGASSDTEYAEGDVIVPSCDAWLDNSKTMSYTGGNAGAEDAPANGDESRADKEREAWSSFKNEILRIAHTLRLKGWRRVPLGQGDGISVQRLSGALTNAVYVVCPPAELTDNGSKNKPTKVLLRVYGPQVEHLIDRDNELQVLQRLARKKIGPRLLGTFRNGRFEQFFNAITLTPGDLRITETMKQISKRMRELHEGIDLLHHERSNGPGVWKNWDQWQNNVDRIMSYLDQQLENDTGSARRDSVVHAWKTQGYVLGTPWPQFKEMVLKYRAHVERCYESKKDIENRLVFAHNDTQYGNILRIRPDDEKSPLLQPANQHKQLIVIDFEYAGANLAGYEFANHFTEWTYNYHDAAAPHLCNERRYPSVDEQKRFIKAYVNHSPKFPAPGTAGSTPRMGPTDGNASSGYVSSGPSTPLVTPSTAPSTSSIVDFMLDARVPPGGWSALERAKDEQSDKRVRELLDETRLWRPANCAFWVAWGIVQAKIPGLDEQSPTEEDLGPDEFDYLSYSQDRALLFWGDCVQMGLISPKELPVTVRARLKLVDM